MTPSLQLYGKYLLVDFHVEERGALHILDGLSDYLRVLGIKESADCLRRGEDKADYENAYPHSEIIRSQMVYLDD